MYFDATPLNMTTLLVVAQQLVLFVLVLVPNGSVPTHKQAGEGNQEGQHRHRHRGGCQGGVSVHSVIRAPHVSGPTSPSTSSLKKSCTALTAASVTGP